MSQVKVVEAAAWSSPGRLQFQPASQASNRTEGRVSRDGGAGPRAIAVSAVSLDDLRFQQKQRAPQLVKIDVEGAEWEVLQGSERMLREFKPNLLCEVHDPGMIERIRAFLETLDYAAEHWQPVHPRYPDYKQHYVWAVAKGAARARG